MMNYMVFGQPLKCVGGDGEGGGGGGGGWQVEKNMKKIVFSEAWYIAFSGILLILIFG